MDKFLNLFTPKALALAALIVALILAFLVFSEGPVIKRLPPQSPQRPLPVPSFPEELPEDESTTIE